MSKKDTKGQTTGPVKGEFIAPTEEFGAEVTPEALPKQEEFWRPPVRFGSIPVEKEPLGWDRRRGFRKLFPAVMLPTQVVERVEFGHPELEPNRLFWGDNLHVMRQLPSQSIDLIYIDPPFFSGQQYNVIFGDQNELRSFSDIWEGGMPGYLIWLNARLYEMKRLLKKTGSIYVHCDWHASHYIKVEMDKIMGVESFLNEMAVHYSAVGLKAKAKKFHQNTEPILSYAKVRYQHIWNDVIIPAEPRRASKHVFNSKTGKAERVRNKEGKIEYFTIAEQKADNFMEVPALRGKEKIGYPTQKPESILERIIKASSNEGDVVADFFCGGGTTVAVAQRLGRRWIACDQSRVAVAITADRISRLVEGTTGKMFPVPDFTVEHWGVYEAGRLSKTPSAQFREFVLRAFGAGPDDSQADIHGTKGAVPVWVGEPSQRKGVTSKDVEAFANAIRKTVRYQQDNLRDGIMLAWAFRPDAIEAAVRLRELQNTDLNFIRLEQVRIDSPRFREQVAGLSTEHADYENFLTFVQPPKVEMGWKRISARTYKFDVSETAILNAGAKIINVQWDFDYGKRFSSTPGFSFVRGKKKEPALQAQYEFTRTGMHRIACKVQDDMGGEGVWSGEIEVK
ncbi:MAG: DNA-methyltransferase [Nitrospiria bacterium]